MVDTPIGTITTVPVKSKFGSKTNITGALLAIFGVLGVFDILPGDLDLTSTAGAVVAAGGVLVTFFRTVARSVLR